MSAAAGPESASLLGIGSGFLGVGLTPEGSCFGPSASKRGFSIVFRPSGKYTCMQTLQCLSVLVGSLRKHPS